MTDLRTRRPPALHDWLRQLDVAFVPGPTTPLLDEVGPRLMAAFDDLGHRVRETPDDDTDILVTTAPFGRPLGLRDAVLLNARRRFGLRRTPTVYTLVNATRGEFDELLERLEGALQGTEPDPADYEFPGLAPEAYRILHEQGRRGGAILALERLVQVWAKCVRVILIIGENEPEAAFHFDLVGAHPRSDGADPRSFYEDIVLRIVTAESAGDVTDHQLMGDEVPRATWSDLTAPAAMVEASVQLGRRGFFTEPVVIEELVRVPAVSVVSDSVAAQYSEGCFATWEPGLDALVTTVTGSARPIDKGHLSPDDLALVVGVRPDRRGALVRPVEGIDSALPSSEALEMAAMDLRLPRVKLEEPWEIEGRVPITRSKLHGHRAISAYDPDTAEFVPLDRANYDYLVTCGSDAQAQAIEAAFSRSESLRDPEDPRQLAFTLLPGHGIVVAEKWVHGKEAFQSIWEAIDQGTIEVAAKVPQGRHRFTAERDRMVLVDEEWARWA